MGRKKSSCSQYFNFIREASSKCEKATCRFCGWSSAKNTVRMKTHLARGCRDCPEEVRNRYLDELDETEESEVASRNEILSESDPNETLDTTRTSDRPRRVTASRSPKRKRKRPAPRTPTAAEEHREIDRALADYLFSGNLPISTVENPFFVAFCKKMRPSYDLPNRFRIVSQAFINGATASGPRTMNAPLQLATVQSDAEGLQLGVASTAGAAFTAGALGAQLQAVPQPSCATEISQFPAGVQFLRIIPSTVSNLTSL